MIDEISLPPRQARTPRISGLRVARQTLRDGLSVDGPLIQGTAGSDISSFRFAGRTRFVLKRPEYVDHVLHEAPDRYHKSIEYELLRAVVGLSLFTDEDESWRRHRMMLNPVLAKRHVQGLYDLMLAPVTAFMDELQQAPGDPDGDPAADPDHIPINMTREMTRLTLDVVGSALFGRAMGDLARKLRPTVTGGLRAAEFAARLILVANPPWWLTRATVSFIHHSPLLPPPLNRPQQIMRTIDDMVWEVIHDRQAHPKPTDDLLGLLLSVTDEHGQRLPLRRVRDEATTFMLAGHETTANALAWMWYLLALNQTSRDRLLAEVDSVLGGRPPTVADLARLPWTTACFQEAMRMYPPAWIIPRTAIADDVIDGHRIPRGSSVLIPIYAIHHDARWWPDPEVFDPTRFMPGDARSHHRSAYLPFGGGRRICIGQSFALMEATLITALMSQPFVYELVPGHPVEPEATLTLRPRRGLKMTARRRDPNATAVAA